jgi:3-deoxy-D-manno-octulosonic-acid transferase
MRIVYVALTYLLVPFVIAREAWLAMLHRDHRGRVRQRLGYVERARGGGANAGAGVRGSAHASRGSGRALR